MHNISRLHLWLALSLLLVLQTRVLPATAADGQKTSQDLPAKFEAQINDNLAGKRVREAILAVAQYEDAVRACYSEPTYSKGVLLSEADHLRLTCPFPTWKPVDTSAEKEPGWSVSTDLDVKVKLLAPKSSDRLIVASGDFSMERSTSESDSRIATEKLLALVANIIELPIGTPRSVSFENVGELRIRSEELSTPTGGLAELRLFVHNDSVYVVILMCAPSEKAVMRAKLLTLLQSIDFHYKPPQRERIAAIRAKVTKPKDIPQQLQGIRELVQCGEYGAAAIDLETLRLRTSALIPGPVLMGNDMKYDAYGLSLSNPDSTKWASEVDSSGPVRMMLLESKSSPNTNYIIVGSLDPLITYGSHIDAKLEEKAPEAYKKTFLSNIARNLLLFMGKTITSERFRTYRGLFAYEGAAITNTPHATMKIIVAIHPKYLLYVMIMADEHQAAQQFTEYESLLDKALTLK